MAVQFVDAGLALESPNPQSLYPQVLALPLLAMEPALHPFLDGMIWAVPLGLWQIYLWIRVDGLS